MQKQPIVLLVKNLRCNVKPLTVLLLWNCEGVKILTFLLFTDCEGVMWRFSLFYWLQIVRCNAKALTVLLIADCEV